MAARTSQPLAGDAMRRAFDRITAWRLNPDAAVACPNCDADDMQIIDQSSRPYAEWYALKCAACGLDQTFHIPLGPPVAGGLD